MMAVGGLAIAGGLGGVLWSMTSDAQTNDRSITVDTAEAFAAAANKARGPVTILLKPGYYAKIELIRKPNVPGATVQIASADPRNRAVIGELAVAYAPGTVVENVDFERRLGQQGRRYLAFFRDSPRSVIRHARFRGVLDGTPQPHEYALMLRECADCRVESSRFNGLRYGVGFFNADRLAILKNEIRDMQTDGIRGEGADDLVIAGNVIGDFHPAKGDHADGIQLWTNNQQKVNRRIVIRGNLVARGNGDFIQGIFVRDTKSQLPFEEVEIAGNLIVGGSYNGIALISARNITIRDNIVVGYPDQQSWIRLTGGHTARMTGNRATRFLRQKFDAVTEARNTTVRQTSDPKQINTLISNWAAGNRDLDHDGPYLRELLGNRR